MIFLDSWQGRKRRSDNPECVYGYHPTQPTGWRPGGNKDTRFRSGSLRWILWAKDSLRGYRWLRIAASPLPHRTPSLPHKLYGTGRTHNKRSLLLTRGPAPGPDSPRAR